MLRDLISKGLAKAQMYVQQQIAMLIDDFKPRTFTLPSLARINSTRYPKTACSPRTQSGAGLGKVAFT
ncbi:hypothetical protein [Microseira wollei]|uniref:Uncharacterized protein n=1 Tax=Microseira wollei NIES-4236 TaxID=2530354 RepID=A0AAV3X511_9CYAN|nr:hypothetical protein [Microseira wollei]GET37373.1 hypothetical protein MiSe_21260 [Microseira wollei NIES-4236]